MCACVHVYRNASFKNVGSLWINFYCMFHQATRSMLSNTSDKIYFAPLLPSRTDSCPYMGDAHQYPCLHLMYKEFNLNLSCLRHRTTHHLNTSSDIFDVLKGPVPESFFNNCINRVKISEKKIEIHSVSYEREGSKGVCHTA